MVKNNNRIRQLRNIQKLSLPKLSENLFEKENLKISPDALSKYERGEREPKLATWQKMANYFKVPINYLQGITDDIDGWELWENNTGYDKKTIENKITDLIKSGRLVIDDDVQHKIGEAVTYLNGDGKTDYNAVLTTRLAIHALDNEIHDEFYIDPKKVGKIEDSSALSKAKNAKLYYDGSLYHDDMHKEVYDEISVILEDTRNKLGELLNKVSKKPYN